jgi:hypothetical protein
MKPLTIEMLAAAWAHALPGKESCERDSVSALNRFADLSRTSPEVRDRAYLITSSAHKRDEVSFRCAGRSLRLVP